jgi:hypothetical protein
MKHRCRSCGAEIIWATNDHTGGGIPVDAEPVADGNITLDLSGPKVLAHVLRKGEDVAEGTARYVSHFVTCPQGREWRRK